VGGGKHRDEMAGVSCRRLGKQLAARGGSGVQQIRWRHAKRRWRRAGGVAALSAILSKLVAQAAPFSFAAAWRQHQRRRKHAQRSRSWHGLIGGGAWRLYHQSQRYGMALILRFRAQQFLASRSCARRLEKRERDWYEEHGQTLKKSG